MDKNRVKFDAGTALNFKMGPVANLASVAIAPGTIYVTSDERSMYVDLKDKRIRLGDFNVYEDETALKNEIHFSETSLYYVKSTGILYVCVSVTNNYVNLKPINDMSEVAELKTTVAEKLDTDTYNSDKEALEGRLDDIDGAIQALDELLGGEEGAEGDNTIFQRVTALEETTNELVNTTLPGYETAINGKVDSNDFETFKTNNTAAINLKADTTELNRVENEYKAADQAIGQRIDAIDGEDGAIAVLQTAVNAKVETTDFETFQTNNTAAINLKADATELARVEREYKAADQAIGQRIDAISGENGSIATLQTAVDAKVETTDFEQFKIDNTAAIGLKADATELARVEREYKQADEDIKTRISAIDGENGTVAALQSAVASKAEVSYVNNIIGVNSDGKVSDGTISADNVVGFVNSKFTAFNAMTFKGSVSKYEDLPLTADAGDTWLLNDNDSGYAAGDLFVANADGVAAWTHVPSGYNSIHEQKLMGVHEENAETGAVTDQLLLYNATNESLTTSVTIVSEGAVKATMTDTVSPQLTIGMYWGEF